MAITKDQFKGIVGLIEDGEVDDYIVDLQKAIDDRNERRKDDILRLVKSAWGSDAQIVSGRLPPNPTLSSNVFINKAQREGRAPIEYVPETGPQLPGSYQDPMGQRLPTPIESQGMGGGGGPVAGPQAVYSPVPDPLASGSDPFGDRNPDIVSTGAQIG